MKFLKNPNENNECDGHEGAVALVGYGGEKEAPYVLTLLDIPSMPME